MPAAVPAVGAMVAVVPVAQDDVGVFSFVVVVDGESVSSPMGLHMMAFSSGSS